MLVLRHRHQAVAHRQQQNADGAGGQPLLRRRQRVAAPGQETEQHDAGNQKANAGHHQRRPLRDAEANDEIGGTPNDI